MAAESVTSVLLIDFDGVRRSLNAIDVDGIGFADLATLGVTITRVMTDNGSRRSLHRMGLRNRIPQLRPAKSRSAVPGGFCSGVALPIPTCSATARPAISWLPAPALA